MNVYLDNNATTRPLPAVVKAMEDCLSDSFANPSSTHLPGRLVRAKVEQARQALARLIGCRLPAEVVFTSGGTESINQAFCIASHSYQGNCCPLIVSTVEHAAVLDAAKRYASQSAPVSFVSVDGEGNLDLTELKTVLSRAARPAFVSMILANNETGVVFPVKKIATLARQYGALLHIDAVQAAGKMPIDVKDIDCDYLSLSAHKFHGPKGVGALYVRHKAPRSSLIHGHQESGLRGGTENVPGIVGMGVAAEVAVTDQVADESRLRKWRDALEAAILHAVRGCEVNGAIGQRVCNTTNLYFPKRNAATLVEQLSARGVHVSAGAACTTGGDPSHVLLAMGMERDRASSSLRLSLGKFTTQQDVLSAIEVISAVVSSSLSVYAVD